MADPLPPLEEGFEHWPASFNRKTGMLSVPHADGLSWLHVANFHGNILEEMRAYGQSRGVQPEELPPTKLVEKPGLGVGHAGGITFCWSGTVHDFGNIIAEVRNGHITRRYRIGDGEANHVHRI